MDLVKAVDKVLLFRILGEEGNAWKIAFQTESETEESRDFETEETKDGQVKSAGAYEASHSMSSFMSRDDEYIGKLKELVRKADGKLEVWEIDRSGINGDSVSTLRGDYSVDVVTTVSTSAGSEGNVEVSIDTEVEKGIVSGDVEVTPELTDILRQINEEIEFVQPMQQA